MKSCNKRNSGFTKRIEHASRVGSIVALSYLYFPFLAFDIGWIRPTWSIPIAIVSMVGFVLACEKMPKLWVPEGTVANFAKGCACALILAIWVTWSGIGGYVWGEVDHLARNTVFKMLVERSWPLYSNGIPGLPPDAEPSILSYYVGFFLPAAVIGKLTSLRAGFFLLWCWAFLGVCIAYYLLCAKLRKLSVWPVLVFVFFSGADSIGVILKSFSNPGVIPFWSPIANFEQWSAYNYSSQTTQLFWVYNQAIPAWIATGLLVCGIPSSVSLLAASCLMINATFPFVGVSILALIAGMYPWRGFKSVFNGEFHKALMSRFVTVTNLCGIVSIGIPSYVYLSANTAGSRFGLYFHWTYFPFIVFEVLILLVPIYRNHKTNPFFRTVLLALLLLPFGTVGFNRGGDFHFRTSIPFLFIVLVWYVESIDDELDNRNWRQLCVLCSILLLGAFTPLHEMSRTAFRMRRIPDLKEYWASKNEPEAKIMQFGRYFFTAPTKANRFCEWFSKPSAPTEISLEER